MSWILFYFLAALYPVMFLVIAWNSDTWRMRIFGWTLLAIPATLYCWDFFAIQNEHKRLCEAEGGLKVLIPPEKADRVRIIGHVAGFSPKDMLERYYPQVTVIEALTEKRDPMTGRPLEYYEAYTTTPNPKAGQWIKGSPQEGRLLFPSTRVDVLDPNMFELSKVESDIAHGTKTELILSKGGKVYAKYTKLVHWWMGIRYPDALPTWRCPEMIKSPPKDEPNAPYEKWHYPASHITELPNLIFK